MMNKRPYLFKPGDRVQLLYRNKYLSEVAIVREVADEKGWLIADVISENPNEFAIYAPQDNFMLATPEYDFICPNT